MRGRKHDKVTTKHTAYSFIKKESPNEGTETRRLSPPCSVSTGSIKKESPNEGTETLQPAIIIVQAHIDKKRIPE